MSPIDKQKSIFFKFLSIFSVVRIYNILIIVLAQYLTSIFILSDKKLFDVIFDFNLFLLILCSSLSIASGYIINNFYDQKKDIINKPIKSKIDDVVKKSTKLYFYFILNFVVIFFASIISCVFDSRHMVLHSKQKSEVFSIPNLALSFCSCLRVCASQTFARHF